MIQFNLLPDIKIAYLKAKRQKHLVMLASTVVIIASVAVMAIMASTVFGLQRKNINDLTRDIESAAEELQSTPDLNKILTVQNQLNVLPQLHNDKPVAQRVFTYINQATPTQANISRLNVDFTGNTMTISGSADTLETINKFVDTLKFTNYTTNGGNGEQQAFGDVVLGSFGRDATSATYTIDLGFDAVIFSETEEVELVVPNIITTRSEVEQPDALFEDTE